MELIRQEIDFYSNTIHSEKKAISTLKVITIIIHDKPLVPSMSQDLDQDPYSRKMDIEPHQLGNARGLPVLNCCIK